MSLRIDKVVKGNIVFHDHPASDIVGGHNDLTGLQGGTTDEYYHLTNTELTNLNAHLIDYANPHQVTAAQVGALTAETDPVWTSEKTSYSTKAVADTLYEPKNSNIQSHITDINNPHQVTANQVLPSQTGNSGKYLTTDGSNSSWATVSSGGAPITADFTADFTAAGDTQAQFTITDVHCLSTSKIQLQITSEETTNNSSDDISSQQLIAQVVSKTTGSFDVLIQCLEGIFNYEVIINYYLVN